MPGILYVVATPIGNLEDVTLRALRTLREVDLIAAEDTRRTTKLLQHYSISTPTTSLHQHNERRRTPAIVAQLQAGQSVALVTDAGTPVVSDPGADLVAAAHQAGIKVEPIPGASALMAALSASGFLADQFVFAGFPPPRANARKRWLAEVLSDTRTTILYEAPHRIRQTLADMLEVAGDRTIALGRELTKMHEELVIRPISTHLQNMDEGRGEYTLVVSGTNAAEMPALEAPGDVRLSREFCQLTENMALSRKEAIKHLAKKYSMPTRTVYAAVHRADKSVE
jgi:16S rRNA (cytidine1402-2'-O)-methyltransferase